MSERDQSLPYSRILGALITSIMHAQGDLIAAAQGDDVNTVDDRIINRHFVWLASYYDKGDNRHLFDGVGENNPIRKIAKDITSLNADIFRLLRDKRPLPLAEVKDIYGEQT